MIKILILGSKGMLGRELHRVFASPENLHQYHTMGWDREDIDVTDFEKLKIKISLEQPNVIFNCVAYNDVDRSESKQDLAFLLNAELPKNLAEICGEKIILVHFSSNYIFDGKLGIYQESDTPNPLSVYAKSKFLGEQEILKQNKKYYIIRTAVLFGPAGSSMAAKKSFVDLILEKALNTKQIKVVNDEINSVTFVVDLVAQVLLLLKQKPPFGIYHITNSGEASWYDIAKEIFKLKKILVDLIPVSSDFFLRSAIRPKKAVLISNKLLPLRSWKGALKEYLNHSN